MKSWGVSTGLDQAEDVCQPEQASGKKVKGSIDKNITGSFNRNEDLQRPANPHSRAYRFGRTALI
jgi:hypothetical protein